MKVKQLVWSDNRVPCEDCRYDRCSAETPFGRFLITWKSWKEPHESYVVDEAPWGDPYEPLYTLEKAKQWCQDECAHRIAMSLESQSQIPLSSATKAVQSAFDDAIGIDLSGDGYIVPLVAAIRTAANSIEHHWDGAECVDHLCAIANELENTQ